MSDTCHRASICTWSLRAIFLRKQQAVDAIKLILDESIDFNVEYSIELDATKTLYVIDVDNMPWANNLVTVANILQSVDEKQ